MPDKHTQHKSKYTADRMIPGAFEGETVTRRRFMTVSSQAMGGIAAASFALPALGFAIGPIFKQPPHFWEDIGSTEDFTNNNYIPVVITVAQGIGEAGKTTAYVRQHNDAIDTDPYDRNTPYIAISTRCAHLGCPVRWVDAAERFICPCHGGVYDLLGRRVGGPPVRPLDRFPTRVQRRPGRTVQRALQRQQRAQTLLARAIPGEPIDGIGQYLYPSRPSARKL